MLPNLTVVFVFEIDGQVVFRVLPNAEAIDDAPHIDPETMHDAKTAAPGYDVYALYEEWVAWWRDMGQPDLKSPGGAFVGFCKKRHERKPLR